MHAILDNALGTDSFNLGLNLVSASRIESIGLNLATDTKGTVPMMVSLLKSLAILH